MSDDEASNGSHRARTPLTAQYYELLGQRVERITSGATEADLSGGAPHAGSEEQRRMAEEGALRLSAEAQAEDDRQRKFDAACEAILARARTDAATLVAKAEAESREILAQAQREARRVTAEADRAIGEWLRELEDERHDVLDRAQVTSSELVAQAEAERERLMTEARQEAVDARDRLMEEARAEAARLRERASLDIEVETQRALDAAREEGARIRREASTSVRSEIPVVDAPPPATASVAIPAATGAGTARNGEPEDGRSTVGQVSGAQNHTTGSVRAGFVGKELSPEVAASTMYWSQHGYPRYAALIKSKKKRTLIRNTVIVAAAVLLTAGIATAVVLHTTGSKPTPAATVTRSTVTRSTGGTGSSAGAAQRAANAVAVGAGCPASPKAIVNTQRYAALPAMITQASHLYSATVVTTTGTFVMALNAKSAPVTVNNFVFLAQQGFFHCVTFYRVVPGFAIQTGDPTGTGTGGPGYTIPDENPPRAPDPSQQYPLGSVAMGNTGAPHTGGSQFFIVAGPLGEVLPNTYALFGRVISGMEVVHRINAQGSATGVPPDVTQRILSITINQSNGF
ncbi:MAG TPA: peptidylprolyl isomerase [Acidimicrobiales bacterium]|nr:peptidylprolyl isomerase [Acidimicrobiales bacterium]